MSLNTVAHSSSAILASSRCLISRGLASNAKHAILPSLGVACCRLSSGALLERQAKIGLGKDAAFAGASWEGVPYERRTVSAFASLAPAEVAGSSPAANVEVKRSTWDWNYEGQNLRVFVVEHSTQSPSQLPSVLLLPSPSDVSTVEEWSEVARALASRPGKERRVVVVDFPGFGASDSPPLDYTSDMLEKFVADFVSQNPSISLQAGPPPVVIGAGHAATLAVKAASKNLFTATALVAVSPTWAGPLPIVFGKSEKMQFRYDLLRNVLRSPGLGWALYKYVLSSPKNVRSQYLSHVYSNKNNVTEALLTQRIEVTQREGARFAPASFISGKLDPASSRDEFLAFFGALEDIGTPTLVISSTGSPRRSKAEMESLENAKGVTKFVKVPGALLPHEEYPQQVSREVVDFLDSL